MLRPGGARRKGSKAERLVAAALRDLCDPHASRVPGSGAFAGLPGDVMAKITPGRTWRAEVKSRKQPPKTLLGWLGTNDVLFIRADGVGVGPAAKAPEITVMLPWRSFEVLVRAAHEGAATAAEALPLAPGAKG